MGHGVIKRGTKPTSGASFEWVDDDTPDLEDILARNPDVDSAALIRWLGPRLGDYRSQVAGSVPNPAAARQYLEELAGTAARMRELLGSTVPDAMAADRLHFTAKDMGLRWQAMSEQLRLDLACLERVVTGAEARLRGLQAARGRKSARPRDMLLADLVKYLRAAPMKADPARNVATEILVCCGIDTPAIKSADKTDATRRAERRGLKKG